MKNQSTLLTEEEALKAINRIDLLSIIETAYQGDGYVWFDLSAGNVVEEASETTVKLYHLPNPLDNVPDPQQTMTDKNDLDEEELEAIEEEAE